MSRPALRALLAGVAGLLVVGRVAVAQQRCPDGRDRPARPVPSVTWENHKTRVRLCEGELSLSTRIQGRWTRSQWDENRVAHEAGIPRASTTLEGELFSPALSLELQVDWADEAQRLQDAILGWRPFGRPSLELLAGRMKAPFGRQRITSSGRLQLIDRSVVTREFTGGRHLGIQARGRAGKALEYRLGAFRVKQAIGSEEDARTQVDARLSLRHGGDPKYSESDFESGSRVLAALGVNAEHLDGRGSPAFDDARRTTVGVDAVVKARGLSLMAEAMGRYVLTRAGRRNSAHGGLVQAGYFLHDRRVELVGRLAGWWGDGERETEAGVGLNLFLVEHDVKLQAAVLRLRDRESGVRAELAVQMQVVF